VQQCVARRVGFDRFPLQTLFDVVAAGIDRRAVAALPDGERTRALLKYSLCAADVHWISLRPELEGLVVPSKFYGVAAAGRPIIAISAKDGEIARLVERYACGFVIEPGNAQELAETLMRLSTDTERIADMGTRSRAMLEAHFTRRQAFERWQHVLDNIK
jgi:colanic acid biosynthesis glycosyl transferase WcaI